MRSRTFEDPRRVVVARGGNVRSCGLPPESGPAEIHPEPRLPGGRRMSAFGKRRRESQRLECVGGGMSAEGRKARDRPRPIAGAGKVRFQACDEAARNDDVGWIAGVRSGLRTNHYCMIVGRRSRRRAPSVQQDSHVGTASTAVEAIFGGQQLGELRHRMLLARRRCFATPLRLLNFFEVERRGQGRPQHQLVSHLPARRRP